MSARNRLPEICRWLETALDCDEEYLYEGEMCNYMRTFASDARTRLRMTFRTVAPTEEEIALCVAELTKPERVANGKSKQFLLTLNEFARPIIEKISRSDDAHLRLFALEAGDQWTYYRRYSPLYGLTDMRIALLDDADERVRVAAVASCSAMLRHDIERIKWMLEASQDNELTALYRKFFERFGDKSNSVRAAVAEALDEWAANDACFALTFRLEREDDPAVREILARLIKQKNGDRDQSSEPSG